MCILEGEDDLADFMIEIDILAECKHSNIVELYEAFFVNSKLWVNYQLILINCIHNKLSCLFYLYLIVKNFDRC